MRSALAVALKIPDNTAYTAMVALRRLGIAVERLERSTIYVFEGNGASLVDRIKSDETIFNPNKHQLTALAEPKPAEGEVWIVPLQEGEASQAIAWRLFDADGPVSDTVVSSAIEALLCNPAIERAVTRSCADGTGHFFP